MPVTSRTSLVGCARLRRCWNAHHHADLASQNPGYEDKHDLVGSGGLLNSLGIEETGVPHEEVGGLKLIPNRGSSRRPARNCFVT